MLQFINVLRVVLAIIPEVIAILKALEAAMPETGKGKDKLEAVRVVLEAVFSQAGGVVVTFEEAWPILQKAIGGIVGVFNASGTFKSTAQG